MCEREREREIEMDMNSQTRIVVTVVAGPLVLYAIYYFLKSSKPSFLKERTIDFDVSSDFGTFYFTFFKIKI